jgi:hypothetical protein
MPIQKYDTPQIRGWVRGYAKITKTSYASALEEFKRREKLEAFGTDASIAFKYAPPGEDSEDYYAEEEYTQFSRAQDEPEYIRSYMQRTGPIEMSEGMRTIFSNRFVRIKGSAQRYKDLQRGVIVSYRTYRAYKRMYAGQ